jgi:propionyl-CoA carboxylase alpha chain
VKYQPPSISEDVRVDTGVYEGGEIPMFYDSMIAKLITHGGTRDEAISKMQVALNQFVIQGIDSNIPFQATLMQHPDFQSGQINTGFIAKNFPQGFMGASLDQDTKLLLSAIAGSIHLQYVNRSGNITGQLEGHKSQVPNQLTVVIGEHGKQEYIPLEIEADGDGDHVVIQETEFDILSNWHPGEILFEGLVNNSPIVLQANRQSVFYELLYNGIRFQAMVMSRSKAELQRLMPFKAPPDMSQYLLSPMPGLLSEVSVEVGQKVQVGQKLAIIEAMKMENVMLAQHEGIVAQILAKKGESLSVDQMIIRFDKEK